MDEELEPGSTVVMVTDGVVEGRDYDIDEGIDRMAAKVSRAGPRPCDEVARRGRRRSPTAACATTSPSSPSALH